MGANSRISWTDHTFNPWWGCVEVSPACDHCYARIFAKRLGFDIWGKDAPRRFFGDAHWNEPLKWNRQAGDRGARALVFVASMADVGEQRPDLVKHRERLFRLIDATPHLDYLWLTKRPRGTVAVLPTAWRDNPRSNVLFGFTAEDQPRFEQRLEEFLKIPSATPGFISFEPLLGRVNPRTILPLNRRWWFLVGGESTPHARPTAAAWARELRDYAIANDLWFHFKQWGEWIPIDQHGAWEGDHEWKSIDAGTISEVVVRLGTKASGRLLDGCEWLQRPEAQR